MFFFHPFAPGKFFLSNAVQVKTILLIEDEPLLRSSLARLLTRDGYLVTEAQNAGQARAALNSAGCDLAIVDLWLEDGLQGLSLIREIHRHAPRSRILVISASGTPEIREAALSLGIDRFYDKPFEIPELRGTVREMLSPGGEVQKGVHGFVC